MTALIKISNLVKIYNPGPNQTVAVDNISLEIKNGEFVAIIGSSGSGKSTLMNIIGCLDRAEFGEYYLDGKFTGNFDDSQLSKIRNQKIGFIFQSFNLLARTSALANAQLPLLYANVAKEDRIKRAKEILVKLGLRDRIYSTPAQLSGGQQQKVAIARALVNNPSLILADEPTGNLDSKSSAEIIDILKSLNKEGRTIILITHEVPIAKAANRIITISDGKIIKDQTIRK